MSIAHALLAEFEQEVNSTRKFLERLPENQLAWQPHPKSMSLGRLALHIATTPGGVAGMAMQDASEVPENAGGTEAESREQILKAFDESVATVRQILPQLSDERLMAPWKLTMKGVPILEIPRVGVLRSIMLNHWYQHRGQLGVYLRLLEIPVPSTYGPSADEMPAFLQKEMAA